MASVSAIGLVGAGPSLSSAMEGCSPPRHGGLGGSSPVALVSPQSPSPRHLGATAGLLANTAPPGTGAPPHTPTSAAAAAAAVAAHAAAAHHHHQQQQQHDAFAAINASQAALFGSCQLAGGQGGGLLGGLGGISGFCGGSAAAAAAAAAAAFFPAGLDLATHLQLQRQYSSSLTSLQQHLQNSSNNNNSNNSSCQQLSASLGAGNSASQHTIGQALSQQQQQQSQQQQHRQQQQQQQQQLSETTVSSSAAAAAAVAAAAAASGAFNPAQSPLLSPFFASRFFAQPSSPSPPSASPLKIKKEDSCGAFQPVVLQHDDTPSPKFARMDYLSAAASISSGIPATPSTLSTISSPGSDSFSSQRSHQKLSHTASSSGSDSVSGCSMLLKGESPTQPPPPGLAHFKRGAVIRLADGKLRTVEQVSTEDLVRSAEATPGVRLDSSRVLRLELAHQPHSILITFAVTSSKQEVSVESPVDRPFFVFNRGWSSCDPAKTLLKLGLQCHKLQPGDICVTLSKNAAQGGSSVPTGAASVGSVSEEDNVNDLRRYPLAVKGNRRWSAPDAPTNLSVCAGAGGTAAPAAASSSQSNIASNSKCAAGTANVSNSGSSSSNSNTTAYSNGSSSNGTPAAAHSNFPDHRTTPRATTTASASHHNHTAAATITSNSNSTRNSAS